MFDTASHVMLSSLCFRFPSAVALSHIAQEVLRVVEDDDVITLLDEEGAEHEFNIVDVLEVGEKRYAILQPRGGGEESDAVIFRMEGDTLITIEDDAEFERVRQAFEATEDESPDDVSAVPQEERGTPSH